MDNIERRAVGGGPKLIPATRKTSGVFSRCLSSLRKKWKAFFLFPFISTLEFNYGIRKFSLLWCLNYLCHNYDKKTMWNFCVKCRFLIPTLVTKQTSRVKVEFIISSPGESFAHQILKATRLLSYGNKYT